MNLTVEECFDPESKDKDKSEISISLKLSNEIEIKNMGEIICAARLHFNKNPKLLTLSLQSFLEAIEERYKIL